MAGTKGKKKRVPSSVPKCPAAARFYSFEYKFVCLLAHCLGTAAAVVVVVVVVCRLVTDRETGRLKGFGFCEYNDLATAESAKRNLNGWGGALSLTLA